MELRIDQNVLDHFPSLNIVRENDNVVTVKFDNSDTSDFLFPLNFPLHNLDNLSWRRIDEIGRAGKARALFALGATKKVLLKNGFIAEYQIMGFDHDDLADDSGKAPISWDMVDLYKDEIYMKKDSEPSCWDDSDGRAFLNGDFFDLLPDDLQAVVKPVWKLTANRAGEIVRSKDRVWLKSEKELFGRITYSYDGEGHWYDLFRQEDVLYFKKNGDNEKDWQWLRSPYCGSTTSAPRVFCLVDTSGAASSGDSGFSYGVAPDFCT